jgi:phosphoglycerol transferase MdoB-like AlkP superfamily enzyme
MRQRLKLFLFFAIFWIGFQIVARALFLAYNHDLSHQLTTAEILSTFLHGFTMDLSISGYFLMLTGLFLAASVFTSSRWVYLTMNSITIFILLACSIIVMVDIELYRHWGFRMDTTPLFYLAGAESEAVGSVDVITVIKLLLVLAALFTIFLFLYSTWLMPKLNQLKPTEKKSALVLLLVSGLMFLPIRGSFTVAPMNVGFVYFHPTKAYANHAAVNVIWNFFYKLQKAEVVYPRNFYDNASATIKFEALYPPNDSTVHLFNRKRPNIVLFILESFTAQVIEPLGGEKGLTPNLNQLCSEGVLFTNFFSSGERTDKGVISILSGYPAQPRTSIIKYASKAQKLPYLFQSIKNLGYTTSFVYGGDVDFANFRAYLTSCNLNSMTTYEDFPGQDVSKWGVHDHIVFERAFQEIDTATSPFFKVVLSLSSHEPFDVPMTPYIPGTNQESLFLNSAHYTDKCIGDFMAKAKQSEWWKNSVVIFVADHGSRHPHNKELKDKERYRIPLLMVGGAIKKDTVVNVYANQTDLANTLLGQLDRPASEFRFSKNALASNARSFAFYFFNDGYGYVAPGKYIVHDNSGKQFLNADGATQEDLDLTKAYQQILYLDYNSK